MQESIGVIITTHQRRKIKSKIFIATMIGCYYYQHEISRTASSGVDEASVLHLAFANEEEMVESLEKNVMTL